MSYINEQQIYFQNKLYDMNIYIESDMESMRDIPFKILSVDNNTLNSSFWQFVKHVQTYSKRMQLPLKRYNKKFFNKKLRKITDKKIGELEEDLLLKFSKEIFPTNFYNYSEWLHLNLIREDIMLKDIEETLYE